MPEAAGALSGATKDKVFSDAYWEEVALGEPVAPRRAEDVARTEAVVGAWRALSAAKCVGCPRLVGEIVLEDMESVVACQEQVRGQRPSPWRAVKRALGREAVDCGALYKVDESGTLIARTIDTRQA